MGLFDSVGGFLGIGNGPQMGPGNFGNDSLKLGQQGSDAYLGNLPGLLSAYSQGQAPSSSLMDSYQNEPGKQLNAQEALATSPLTGSQYATEQVQNNPMLGQLFGKQGLLPQEIATEQGLQNQGYSLQPQDVTAYGQASGNIARLFGNSENQLSQSLADRGISAAPSGAAGAMFSGLSGNKNEQLANAQTQIANARMQNTMQRIGQQQQFIGQLGGQGENAIQGQFGRNLAGVQNRQGNTANTASQTMQNNQAQNQGALQSAEFNAANKPMNFADFATAGIGQGLQGGLSGGLGGRAGSSGTYGGQQYSSGGSGIAGLFG